MSKRVRSMIKKIDAQLEKYDEKVGSSLNLIQTNAKGQISLDDLKRAMAVIAHAPAKESVEGLGKKLDVDSDGFVELEHVIELTQDAGLGIVMEDEAAQKLLNKGANIRQGQDAKDIKDLKWVSSFLLTRCKVLIPGQSARTSSRSNPYPCPPPHTAHLVPLCIYHSHLIGIQTKCIPATSLVRLLTTHHSQLAHSLVETRFDPGLDASRDRLRYDTRARPLWKRTEERMPGQAECHIVPT